MTDIGTGFLSGSDVSRRIVGERGRGVIGARSRRAHAAGAFEYDQTRTRVRLRSDAMRRRAAYLVRVHPAVQLADSPRRPTRGDVLLVAVFAVWGLLEAFFVNEGGPAWARALAALGYALPLLWRRQAPIAALGAIAGVAALRAFTTDTADQGAMPFPALLVATFSVGLYVRRFWLSLACGAAPIALVAALSWSPMWQGERHAADYAILIFFVSSAWLAGYLIRRRAAQVRAAERAGGERAREAVAAERARIARELHDVVAHSVSIIALQAGAAEARVESDPAAAREHMAVVRRTAHEALVEMRRLLGVLREDVPTYEPTPELTDVGDLVTAAQNAGLPVELCREGDFDGLPSGVSLAVYRLVQESLTNVRKHAGPVPTRVVIHRTASAVELTVENEPGETTVASPNGSGHGLIGMHERVRVYGGVLDARADDIGGFVVRASIPTGEAAE
jgi:signal transduction histidine kinase